MKNQKTKVIADNNSKNISVVYNKELVGIEIYFTDKPSQDIIDGLKDKKFRWNRTKKCWYAKDNQDNREFVNTLLGRFDNAKPKASKQAVKPTSSKVTSSKAKNVPQGTTEIAKVDIIKYNNHYYELISDNGNEIVLKKIV